MDADSYIVMVLAAIIWLAGVATPGLVGWMLMIIGSLALGYGAGRYIEGK